MDFNEIQQININAQPVSGRKKEVKTETNQTIKEEENNIQNAPTDPSYWQTRIGINKKLNNEVSDEFLKRKSQNIASCFGSTIEISEQANEEIYNILKDLAPLGETAIQKFENIILFSHFEFPDGEELETTSKIKNYFKEIYPLGKNAVAVYQEYMNTLGECNFYGDKSKIKKYYDLVPKFVMLYPTANPKMCAHWKYAISKLAIDYSEDEKDYEILHKMIDTLSSLENVSSLNKLSWIFEHNNAEKNRKLDISEEVLEEDFKSYNKIMSLLGNYPKKRELSILCLNTKTKQVFEKLLQDRELPAEVICEIIHKRELSEKEEASFVKLGNELLSNKDKKELFLNLNNHNVVRRSCSLSEIIKLMEGDIKFKNKLITDLLNNAKRDRWENYLANSGYMLSKIISVVNDTNYEDFINTVKEMPLQKAIEFKNSKTGFFDKRLINATREVDKVGIHSEFNNLIAEEIINEETGTIDDIAKDTLEYIMKRFKYKHTSGIRGKINEIKYKHNLHKIIVLDEDIPELIASLKDKNGKFNQENSDFFRTLVKYYEKQAGENAHTTLYQYGRTINAIKNENGIIDKNTASYALKLLKQTKNIEGVNNLLEALNTFPQEKRANIYKCGMEITKNAQLNFKNFPLVAKYCFDKNGEIRQGNYEFTKKLFNINNKISYKENVFKILEQHPNLKNYLHNVAMVLTPVNEYLFDEIEKFIDKLEKNGKTFDSLLQEKSLEYIKITSSLRNFEELYNGCLKDDNEFDKELFDKAMTFMKFANTVTSSKLIIDGKRSLDIVQGNLDVNSLKFNQKISLLNTLREIKNNAEITNTTELQYVNKSILELETNLNAIDISLPIEKEQKTAFVKNVLFSNVQKNELTKFEQIMVDAILQLETMTTGLPLTYSREQFLNDLNSICNTPEKIEILKSKVGISPTLINNKIVGYNGIIQLKELDIKKSDEREIYNCLKKFLYENEVKTGDKKLDEQLNYIIKAFPEFINTIGKKQHGTHKYTVDVHSMLVLSHSLANPDYLEKLNPVDKCLLKTAAIFHDLMKEEGIVDKGHQNLSAIYAQSIIKKIMKKELTRDRLYEIIRNHHWSEEYATSYQKDEKAKELAFRFRRPNDFEIAKIIADADIKSVNESFYERYKDSLTEENTKPIQNNLNQIYENGNVLITDKLVHSKIPDNLEKTIDGRKFKIINFHEISETEDMGKYGFNTGKTKNDLNFIVHMVSNEHHQNIYKDLNTVKLLSSPSNGGVLSESIISPEYKKTFMDRKYGLLLSHVNTDIINQEKHNQHSGYQKDMKNVCSIIFNNYGNKSRNFFRYNLLNNLGIPQSKVSDEEYAEFYKKVLATKNSFSDFNTNTEYKIGEFTVQGKKLVEAIRKHQNDMIDKKEEQHNEIVGYTPKIQAVIAKSNNPDKLPKEVLDFAYENTLPIILI